MIKEESVSGPLWIAISRPLGYEILQIGRSTQLEINVGVLETFVIEGPKTTLPLSRAIGAHPDFRNNHLTTRWLEDVGLPAFQTG
jgi:biotin carboxylase